MLITDILYLLIIGVGTYYSFFNLILWFENRGRIVENKKLDKFPSVSIIVPAYNEAGPIAKTLENITKIDYPKEKLEILVIDDGSTDGTYKIAKKYEKVNLKVFTKKNGGKSNAINFGLKHAKGEFVAVMDADSLPRMDTLKNCMKYFDSDEVASVTTRILPLRERFWQKLQHIEGMLVSFQRKLHEFPNIINCTPGPFSVYRKNVVQKLGGFDENNLVEDVEIAWRLLSKGYKVKLAFDSHVDCVYPYSFKMWWKQRTRWSIGGIQTLFKYMGHIFRKDSHTVGSFLVPTSILGYSLTTVGIGLFVYLVMGHLVDLFLYLYKSLSAGINPLNLLSIGYILDWKRSYGIILGILFLITLKIAMNMHKIKVSIFLVLLYILIYATLFPFINIYAIYKYLRKERGWMTK